jgi:hypothetical protein
LCAIPSLLLQYSHAAGMTFMVMAWSDINLFRNSQHIVFVWLWTIVYSGRAFED